MEEYFILLDISELISQHARYALAYGDFWSGWHMDDLTILRSLANRSLNCVQLSFQPNFFGM